MLPAFKPGDRVVTFNWAKPKIGDVVVFKEGEKNFIKRVKNIKGTTYYVFGDNKKESSRVAPFSKNKIIGKVIYKY